MERGIFQGTFYCPEGPEVDLGDMPIELNDIEKMLVDDVMASETLTRMELELAAVGNGLVWNKDHFEMLPKGDAEDCEILMRHREYHPHYLTELSSPIHYTLTISSQFTLQFCNISASYTFLSVNFLFPLDLENKHEVTKSNTFISEMSEAFDCRFPNSMGRYVFSQISWHQIIVK